MSKETKVKTHADKVKDKSFKKLVALGKKVYGQLEEQKYPDFEMPLRASSNIYYDLKTRQYSVGEKKVRRSAGNVRHLKPFLQTMFVASFAAISALESTEPSSRNTTVFGATI